MKRRDFFKSILSAAALIALPSWLRRPTPEDFTIEFYGYKNPSSTHVSDLRSKLDIDNIEPINIPFRHDYEWHHYGLTRKSGELTWYIDGEKV